MGKRTLSIIIVFVMLFSLAPIQSYAVDTTISTAVITGVTAPVKGATPVVVIPDTTEYTATVDWSGAPAAFAADTIYTATITITPTLGYTLSGVPADFFTVSGAVTVNNTAGSGIVTAVFPKTDPDLPAPQFVSATTNSTGSKVSIQFDKAMADPSADAASFSVRINGISYYESPVSTILDLSSATLNADPTIIDLTLVSLLKRGDIVTVEYNPGGVVAADASVLAAFTAQPVANVIPVDITSNLPGTWQIFDHVGNWGEAPYPLPDPSPLPNADDPRGKAYNRHIVISGNTVYFYGNGVKPFKDFLYLPSTNNAAKSFTFKLDLSGVKYHSMEGGGFLFNTDISGGMISGYCVLFKKIGVSYYVNLYQIDGIDVNAFHEGTSYNNLGGNSTGIIELGSFPLSVGDTHTILLESSASTFDMWDGNNKLISGYTLPKVYSNGVGVIGSYQSHSCSELSYFIFSGLSIRGVADLSAALAGTQANLTFTAPIGSTAVSVEKSTDGGTWSPATIAGVISPTSTTATVTGLTTGQTYYFRLVITGGLYDGYSRIASAPYEGVPTPVESPATIPATLPNVALSVAVQGNGSVWPEAGDHAFSQNSIVILSDITPDPGWLFMGWAGVNGNEIVNDRLTMDANKQITAIFEPITPAPIPEAAPLPEEIVPEPVVPETEPVPDVIISEPVPEAEPVLPKTNGFPLSILLASGAGLIGFGTRLGMRKK